MRRARYLAPWRREGIEGDLEGMDPERMTEVLGALRGKPAIYHCVSRVVNRERVLGTREKEHFVTLLRAYERFCHMIQRDRPYLLHGKVESDWGAVTLTVDRITIL